MNKYCNQYRFCDEICYIDCFNCRGELRGTVLIDKEDYNIIKDYTWHIENSRAGLQYAQASTNGKLPIKTVRIHRLLINTINNTEQVDHINHNGLDNRKANLRVCNNRNNNCNKNFQRNPKSGHTGIRYNEKVGSYYVRIMVNKKEISLGHYKTLEEALEARKQGEIKYFGEFRFKKESI